MGEYVDTATLIVTSRTLYRTRYTVSALKRAIPDARIRGAGFKGIYLLETEGDPLELARVVQGACAAEIGRVVAVLDSVPSLVERIGDSALRIAAEHVQEGETFCFRLHKRGDHGLVEETPKIEFQIGGSIWLALRDKFGKRPPVDLKDPDVTILAEVLGANVAMGLLRKAWRVHPEDSLPESEA